MSLSPEILSSGSGELVLDAVVAVGGDEAWGVHSSILGPHTELHQMGSPGMPSIWVKRYLRKAGEAEREYHFFRRIRPMFPGQDGLHAVEPLALLERHNALVTRHAEGLLLADRIRCCPLWSVREVRQIETFCIRSARWLARLHEAEGGPCPGLAEENAQAVLAMVLRNRVKWGLPVKLVERIKTFIARCLETADSGQFIPVRVHGDFGPHNILASEEALTVIDASFPEDIPRVHDCSLCFEDISRFYVCLRGYRMEHAFSLRRKYWARAFLRAYQESRGRKLVFESGLFPLFHLKYLLHAWEDWPLSKGAVGRHEEGKWLQLWMAAKKF